MAFGRWSMKVAAVSFHGFEQIEASFEKEWRRLVKEAQRAKG